MRARERSTLLSICSQLMQGYLAHRDWMGAERRCPTALRHLTGRNTPVHRPCPPSAHALQNAASASASSNRPSHPSIACRTAAQPRPTSPFPCLPNAFWTSCPPPAGSSSTSLTLPIKEARLPAGVGSCAVTKAWRRRARAVGRSAGSGLRAAERKSAAAGESDGGRSGLRRSCEEWGVVSQLPRIFRDAGRRMPIRSGGRVISAL
jgi:hypothetical protein